MTMNTNTTTRPDAQDAPGVDAAVRPEFAAPAREGRDT
jgi:hypothetical protein